MQIQLETILCPIDFSEPSLNALSYAEDLAESFGASLLLVHAVEPFYHYGAGLFSTVPPKKMADDFLKQLEELQDSRHPNVPSEARVVVGRPYSMIVELAEEEDVDLIVMGSHGQGGIIGALIGSVAEKVVRNAPCPVLTVKEPPPTESADGKAG